MRQADSAHTTSAPDGASPELTEVTPAAGRDALPDEIEARQETRRQAERDRLDALYAEWLTNRAEILDPKNDLKNRDDTKHADREDELARLICTTPCVYPWMILRKIEVLQYYMTRFDGTSWTDNREITMLGGIVADLLRFDFAEKD